MFACAILFLLASGATAQYANDCWRGLCSDPPHRNVTITSTKKTATEKSAVPTPAPPPPPPTSVPPLVVKQTATYRTPGSPHIADEKFRRAFEKLFPLAVEDAKRNAPQFAGDATGPVDVALSNHDIGEEWTVTPGALGQSGGRIGERGGIGRYPAGPWPAGPQYVPPGLPTQGLVPVVLPPPPVQCSTLARRLAMYPNLVTFLRAIEVAGMSDYFDDPELSVTVFAPTDLAFEQLAQNMESTVDEIISDDAFLIKILKLHIAPKRTPSSTMKSSQSIDTRLSGSPLLVTSSSGSILVVPPGGESATVVEPDIEACATIVHIVNEVLLPSTGFVAG